MDALRPCWRCGEDVRIAKGPLGHMMAFDAKTTGSEWTIRTEHGRDYTYKVSTYRPHPCGIEKKRRGR